jgi:hypothetical protein
MKCTRVSVLLVVITVFIISCNQNVSLKKEIPVKAYQFEYMNSTGICTMLIDDGKRINIQYHEDSNQENLKSFYALRWFVLGPNADRHRNVHRIIVVGKLHNEVKSTPHGEYYPNPEEYQEFELLNWYIKSPFKKITFRGKTPDNVDGFLPDPDDIGIVEVNALTIDDFVFFNGMESYDLKKYVRD